MILTELNLKNFGRFTDKRIQLKEGMNLFYGENEKGKSTLHMFIRAMLFGLERQRGKASRNDLYSTYEPWHYPAYYAGVLKFESGGKIFRIERSFHKSQKESRLICESDGEELSLNHGDLEMLLGGLEANAFDNTVSVRQMKSAADSSLAAELKNYAANYQKSGDFELDITEALRQLKEEQRRWQRRLKTEQDRQRRNREQVQTKIDFMQVELEQSMGTLYELHDQEESLRKKEQAEQQELALEEVKRPFSIFTGVIVAALASIVLCLLVSNIWISLALSVGCFIAVLFAYFRFAQVREPAVQSDTQEFQQIRWEIQRVTEEIKERNTGIENLKENLEELEVVSTKVKAAEQEIAALELAAETIQRLSGEIRSEQGDQLNQKASAILAAVTDGKYQRIVVDDALRININTSDQLLGLHQVSRGTIEQIYFAIRMAAAELLNDQEPMPVILDETFAFYDEKRAARTLRWLSENKQQVLLFTCQKREEELLKKNGIGYSCPW